MLQLPREQILLTNSIFGCMIYDDVAQKLFCFINNISLFVGCIISEQISHCVLNPAKNEDSCLISEKVWLNLVSMRQFSP